MAARACRSTRGHLAVGATSIAYGLPPGAAITLTANGAPVFIRIGPTVASAQGTYYFPWTERTAATIVFVVSAGGVSRPFTAIF